MLIFSISQSSEGISWKIFSSTFLYYVILWQIVTNKYSFLLPPRSGTISFSLFKLFCRWDWTDISTLYFIILYNKNVTWALINTYEYTPFVSLFYKLLVPGVITYIHVTSVMRQTQVRNTRECLAFYTLYYVIMAVVIERREKA